MVGYGARQHIRKNALQHLHQEITITRKQGSFTLEESLAELVQARAGRSQGRDHPRGASRRSWSDCLAEQRSRGMSARPALQPAAIAPPASQRTASRRRRARPAPPSNCSRVAPAAIAATRASRPSASPDRTARRRSPASTAPANAATAAGASPPTTPAYITSRASALTTASLRTSR